MFEYGQGKLCYCHVCDSFGVKDLSLVRREHLARAREKNYICCCNKCKGPYHYVVFTRTRSCMAKCPNYDRQVNTKYGKRLIKWIVDLNDVISAVPCGWMVHRLTGDPSPHPSALKDCYPSTGTDRLIICWWCRDGWTFGFWGKPGTFSVLPRVVRCCVLVLGVWWFGMWKERRERSCAG